MNRPPSPSPDLIESYRRGVTALLEGRLDEANRDLVGPVRAGLPEALLAQAKIHLERQDGPAARRLLGELLATPPDETGLHAYLLILDAAAAALAGAPGDAFRNLDEASRLDGRMDPAARALRRRLEKNRPPLVRF